MSAEPFKRLQSIRDSGRKTPGSKIFVCSWSEQIRIATGMTCIEDDPKSVKQIKGLVIVGDTPGASFGQECPGFTESNESAITSNSSVIVDRKTGFLHCFSGRRC